VTAPPALPDDLLSTITAWTQQDPDPVTRSQADDLIYAAKTGDLAAVAELTDAFTGRLQFGTAGLRGPLGPGPNRMNRVVVGQAAAGLAGYLLDRGLLGGRVLIGYDARNNSDAFARDTAELVAGAGFKPLLTDRPLPTPVTVFGIRHFSCVAGVVVTASHNPPQDNGYKIYLGDGSQIVPPAEADIATRISEIARHDLNDVPRSTDYAIVGGELVSAYLGRIASLVPGDADRDLRWVYTPLHGVGAAVVAGAVAASGFPAASVVAEQAEPNPAFPTVAFPNPEEPGAIDLALAQAERTRADLVVANDPDADRCAVAVPIGGHWRMLRGDELGALLADDALRRKVHGTYACSIVSSSLLSVMAAESGQPFTYTLTGFKWIGRVPGLAFGYEEALGYCVDPAAVPDKDGISALVRVLALAAECKAQRSSLADRLDGIARRYGIYETDQLSVRVDDLKVIADAMARLRARPPKLLAGQQVAVTDLLHGTEQLPPTDAVRMVGKTLTVVVRPSGTEPKLKCYLEARLRPPHSADLPTSREEARSMLRRLRADLATALGLPTISSPKSVP
jgi:phosphomannomutase